MFPQLAHLGIVEADQVCQTVIQVLTPVPGTPASRDQKLCDLGITDAAILLLVNSLAQHVKSRNCTLNPHTLNCLSSGSLYGALVDLVALASRP